MHSSWSCRVRLKEEAWKNRSKMKKCVFIDQNSVEIHQKQRAKEILAQNIININIKRYNGSFDSIRMEFHKILYYMIAWENIIGQGSESSFKLFRK